MSSRRIIGCLAVFSFLLLTAVPLHAHHLPPGMEEVDEFEDLTAFTAGLRHPLSGLDHWVFACIIGLVAFLSAKRGRSIAIALLASAAIGGAVGLHGIVLPGSQFGLVLAVGIVSAIMTLKNKTPFFFQMGLVCLVALWQGNLHGLAWPLDSAGMAYMTGVLSMTLLAVLGGLSLAWLAKCAASSHVADPGSASPAASY